MIFLRVVVKTLDTRSHSEISMRPLQSRFRRPFCQRKMSNSKETDGDLGSDITQSCHEGKKYAPRPQSPPLPKMAHIPSLSQSRPQSLIQIQSPHLPQRFISRLQLAITTVLRARSRSTPIYPERFISLPFPKCLHLTIATLIATVLRVRSRFNRPFVQNGSYPFPFLT